VRLIATPNSVQQMTGLIDGQFDIAMTAVDNVIAYMEGQGEARRAMRKLGAASRGAIGLSSRSPREAGPRAGPSSRNALICSNLSLMLERGLPASRARQAGDHIRS
jgi:hypothetical protein